MDFHRKSSQRVSAGVGGCKRWLARLDFLVTTFALCWLLVRFSIFALRRTG